MSINPKPAARPKTRARILAACKILFNERGPVAVTTAEIAAAVGIQEGNLHYHFNRKEQMLEALYADFEQALRTMAGAAITPSATPQHYVAYLHGWFGLMWEWRCFYRDGAAIYSLAPSLRAGLEAMNNDLQRHVARVMDSMVAADLMRAGKEELSALIVNVWIVATYWLDYLRSRRGVTVITRAHVDWGAAQVFSLFKPYLTASGRAMLDLGSTRLPAAAAADRHA